MANFLVSNPGRPGQDRRCKLFWIASEFAWAGWVRIFSAPPDGPRISLCQGLVRSSRDRLIACFELVAKVVSRGFSGSRDASGRLLTGAFPADVWWQHNNN